MLYNIPIPDPWLVVVIVSVFFAIVATMYIIATEYPPAVALLKKVEIRILVWRANHSRLSDEQQRRFLDLIEEGEIDAVDIRQKIPSPGEPWFFVHPRP